MNWFHVTKKNTKNEMPVLGTKSKTFHSIRWRENYTMMFKDKTVMHTPSILKYLWISDLKDVKEDLAFYCVS